MKRYKMSIFDNPDQLQMLRNLLQPHQSRNHGSDSDDDESIVRNGSGKLTLSISINHLELQSVIFYYIKFVDS